MKSLIMVVLVMAVILQGCENQQVYKGQGQTQKAEAQFTEDQQAGLIKSCPPPKLTFSLERENLKKRLIRFNNPAKISYIYLTDFGKVMAYFTIKGKVSSVNSKLTTGEQLIEDPFVDYRGGAVSPARVVESPQLDGSYGTNGNGIFFFTTEDVYVEWNKGYMVCDQPLKLSSPVQLVQEVKE